MTFTIKIRALPGSPMLVDYECAACSVRFESLVERDASGDAPSTSACACGAIAVLAMSATKITKYELPLTVINPPGFARKHQNDIPPAAKDMKAMIDGKITRGEWDKRERGRRENHRYKKAIKKGYASPKVTVG